MSFVCVSVVAALCCEIKSIYKTSIIKDDIVQYAHSRTRNSAVADKPRDAFVQMQ